MGQPVPGLRVLGGDKASVMWGSLWGAGSKRGCAVCKRERGVRPGTSRSSPKGRVPSGAETAVGEPEETFSG